jgi:hypothetical protein
LHHVFDGTTDRSERARPNRGAEIDRVKDRFGNWAGPVANLRPQIESSNLVVPRRAEFDYLARCMGKQIVIAHYHTGISASTSDKN